MRTPDIVLANRDGVIGTSDEVFLGFGRASAIMAVLLADALFVLSGTLWLLRKLLRVR